MEKDIVLMDLEGIALNGVSQIEKEKYHVYVESKQNKQQQQQKQK